MSFVQGLSILTSVISLKQISLWLTA